MGQSLRQSMGTARGQNFLLLAVSTWTALAAGGVTVKSCRILGPVSHSRQMAKEEEACSVACSAVEAAVAILEAISTGNLPSAGNTRTNSMQMTTRHALMHRVIEGMNTDVGPALHLRELKGSCRRSTSGPSRAPPPADRRVPAEERSVSGEEIARVHCNYPAYHVAGLLDGSEGCDRRI